MRIAVALIVVATMTGCTRPSSGIGLNDLTDASAEAFREFNGWVKIDEGKKDFPDGLCLASIDFEVKITNSETTGGSVTIPLAAPTAGITSVLGYDLTVTELSEDTLTVPFSARYLNKADADAPDALKRFLADIETIPPREKVRTPHGQIQTTFAQRSDLAAELWRIRESLHGFFLKTANEGQLLVPTKLDIERSYTVTTDTGASATINIAGGPSGKLERRQNITDLNSLVIKFVPNLSTDKMNCNEHSLTGPPKPTPEPKPTLIKIVK